MLSHFGDFLRIDLRLSSEKPTIIGVSGGPDSLCLLDLMVQHRFKVIVAHLDHSLRPESGAEARGVKLVAETLGVPFVLEECDVSSMAESQSLSLEEAARKARYDFLFEQAKLNHAQAVAVGHNADDQVETVLMHLLRGSGLEGLKGMQPLSLPNPWSAEIPLVRPLLAAWRKEILEYCEQRGLEPVFDSSNQDTKFFRNKLRLELIPVLQDYVPGVHKRLWQMADILAEDDAVLQDAVSAARNHCLSSTGPGYVCFDVRVLAYQPIAIQRRLVRWAVSQLRTDLRDLDFAAVERALTLLKPLEHPQPKQFDLALGLRAFLEDKLLYIADWNADLPSMDWPQIDSEIELELPGEVELLQGWRLKAEIVRDVEAARQQALENADPYRAWIDLKDSEPTLNIRPRRPGDYFHPFGMGGKSSKVSNFMINQKIPARVREGWPLVCLGDEIAWVPGYRIGHGFRVSGDTQQAVFLQLIFPMERS